MAKRIILIDVAGAFRANWHASEHQEVSEAYARTISKVYSLSQGYDLCAVCCDWPPYRRSQIYPEYKAHRSSPPEVMVEQFRRVKDRLRADGFVVWECAGYEADDLLATAARIAVDDEKLEVTIASSDKDLLRMVSDDMCVRVVSIASGDVYDQLAVVNKFGVAPRMMTDLLALTGDKSDGVPGIPGVGPKRAAELLNTYGNALNVVECAAEIEGKLGEAIRAHGSKVALALQLVTLETDAPIDFDAVYAERKVEPLTESKEWTDADFTEEPEEQESTPVAAVAEKVEQKPELPPPPQERAKSLALSEPQPQTGIVRAPEWSMALEPSGPRAALAVAEKLYNSRLYQQFQSPEAIFAVMLRGRALGLDATTALSLFHVVEGRPTMHADLIVGLVQKSGLAEFFELKETTHERATWVTKRRGSRREVEITWTMEDALRAGLVTKDGNRYRGVSKSGRASNWDKYPRTMLRHRAATELARAVYSDVTAGLYTPDEISDGQSEILEAEVVGKVA